MGRGQRGHVTGSMPTKTRFDVASDGEDTPGPVRAEFNLRFMTVRTMFSRATEWRCWRPEKQACINVCNERREGKGAGTCNRCAYRRHGSRPAAHFLRATDSI